MLKKHVVFFSICMSLTTIFVFSEPNDVQPDWKNSKKFYSSYLQSEITTLPSVFSPEEAESFVLPYMKNHADIFTNKIVLDIGTGSGIIGLYAAKLGAAKVVVTDINKVALTCARFNSKNMGFSSIFETRFVSQQDISAYSVIKADECFDIIISNPPYALDLDVSTNSPITDNGDLGISILKGLETHLKSDGIAVLLYSSFFYHHVMVNLARHYGYNVKHFLPVYMTPWESDTLFNSYLVRFLECNKINTPVFRFNYKNENVNFFKVVYNKQRLLKSDFQEDYSGLIVITRKQKF